MGVLERAHWFDCVWSALLNYMLGVAGQNGRETPRLAPARRADVDRSYFLRDRRRDGWTQLDPARIPVHPCIRWRRSCPSTTTASSSWPGSTLILAEHRTALMAVPCRPCSAAPPELRATGSLLVRAVSDQASATVQAGQAGPQDQAPAGGAPGQHQPGQAGRCRRGGQDRGELPRDGSQLGREQRQAERVSAYRAQPGDRRRRGGTARPVRQPAGQPAGAGNAAQGTPGRNRDGDGDEEKAGVEQALPSARAARGGRRDGRLRPRRSRPGRPGVRSPAP